jgi:hypothetical protein
LWSTASCEFAYIASLRGNFIYLKSSKMYIQMRNIANLYVARDNKSLQFNINGITFVSSQLNYTPKGGIIIGVKPEYS